MATQYRKTACLPSSEIDSFVLSLEKRLRKDFEWVNVSDGYPLMDVSLRVMVTITAGSLE